MLLKSINLFALAILLATNITAQTPPQDAVLGTWLTADKDGKVLIYKQGDKYFGKISWGKSGRKDTNNPDPKQRGNDLLGTVILKNFKYTGKSWEDGTIYDPNNGKTYSCIIKQKGANSLDIRGYVGISLLGRTTSWTRSN